MAQEAQGTPAVVRFAVPEEGVTVFTDLLRGEIEVDNRQIRDEVLLKADGLPTYHLAAMVDDFLMKITHILRGEEWLATAPLHKQICDAFGWEMPVLVHLPVILDPSGKGKMSKRKKVVAGKEYLALVHEFRDTGYLPDAMFQFSRQCRLEFRSGAGGFQSRGSGRAFPPRRDQSICGRASV